jgi:OOP family OmpA-OmpF porin
VRPTRTAAAIAAGLVLVASGAEERTTVIPVRDGTILYVRYGAPGGVTLVRGARPAAPDSGAAIAAFPAQIDPAALRSLRALLRDELERRALLAAARVRDVGSARATPSPGAIPPPSAIPPAPRPAPVVVVVPEATREAPAESLRIPPADAREPATGPSPPEATAPAYDEPTPAPLPRLSPEVIREAFLSAGLLESNLILFETGSDRLLDPSRGLLAAVAGVLAEFPDARLRVEGHTDDVGSAASNLELSRRRAETVREFLIESGGMSAGRIEAIGLGEAEPLVPNDSPARRALNRRVVLRVENPEALTR